VIQATEVSTQTTVPVGNKPWQLYLDGDTEIRYEEGSGEQRNRMWKGGDDSAGSDWGDPMGVRSFWERGTGMWKKRGGEFSIFPIAKTDPVEGTYDGNVLRKEEGKIVF